MVLVGWGIARIVTTGEARSDDVAGADHCCSKTSEPWRSEPGGSRPGGAWQLTDISGLAATGFLEIRPVLGALASGRCADGHHAG